MTGPRRSFRRRAAWLVPAATAAIVGGAVAVPMAASAGTPDLPGTTPEQLLADVASAHVAALSGQVVETANLGIPALPGDVGAAGLSWQSLVTGSHTITLAFDGAQRQRVALLGTLSESDVVHNGTDLWTYASGTRAVTHVVLPSATAPHPDSTAPGSTAPGGHDPMDLTPLGAAQRLLAAVTPTTAVTTGPTTTVAGRDAYTLIVRPKQAGSTIGLVVVAVDAARHIPLRVQVFGAGAGIDADPVFETGFTSVSFDRPDASTFRFTPPAGSKVTTRQAGQGLADGQHRRPDHTASADPAAARPTVLGTGWTSVVEFAPGTDALASLFGSTPGRDASTSALLDRLFVHRADGSRLLRTALVNVLVTADGRVFAGLVSPDVLQHAAAQR